MSYYGNIVVAPDITRGTIDHLKAWLPSYVAEVERQQGLGAKSLPLPRSWTTRTAALKDGEEQTPAVVVVCPGLAGEPRRDGNGNWSAPWGVAVVVMVGARDPESSVEVSRYYAGAVRACLTQMPALPDLDAEFVWVDEEYTDLPEGRSRALAAATVEFVCNVPLVMGARRGPWPGSEPPEDPYEVPAVPRVDEVSLFFNSLGGNSEGADS